MADDQPSQTGTTHQLLSGEEQFLQNLQRLAGDKFRSEAEKTLARALAAQARELLRKDEALGGVLSEMVPIVGGSVGKNLERIATALIAAVTNGKQISNADGDRLPLPKTTGADPVDLATGQLVYTHVDMRLDGAGITFELTRTYRSQARYPNGPLGACWDCNLNVWLREESPAVIVVSSGELREDRYSLVEPGGLEDDYYATSAGRHSVLRRHSMTGQFELRMPDGTTYAFADLGQFEATAKGLHRIERIFDRFHHRDALTGNPVPPGNYLQFHYDPNDGNVLTAIEVNHPSRRVLVDHDELGRITVVTDYTGRQVRYAYDDYDDLVAVTLPASADHALGRSVFYEYSSDSGATAHQLLSVIDAEGRRYLEVEYGINEGFVDHERVVRQRDDEGDWFLNYADILPARDPTQEPDPNGVEHYTVVRQPNGHHVEHWFNDAGTIIFKVDTYIDDEGVKQSALSRFQYNPDGLLIASLSPENVFVQDFFGRDSYMLEQNAGVADSLSAVAPPNWKRRLSFGNHLGHIRRARVPNPLLAWPSPAIADGIGAVDLDDIVTAYTYEPDFQLLLSSSDPRATAGLSEVQVARLTLYSYVAGDHKALDSITYPATTWPDGTVRAPVETTFIHDDNGRMVQSIDGEGHTTTKDYFASADTAPKAEEFSRNVVVQPMVVSTEGFLRSVTAGATEADEATTRFEVNRRGVVTKATDARGAVSTIRIDSTDQPLDIARSLSNGPTYRTAFSYTANAKVRRRERDVQDDLGNALLDGQELRGFRRNDSGLVTRETAGSRDPSTWLTTRQTYNADGLLTRAISPGLSRTYIRQNARRLAVRTTQGSGTPEAISDRIVYDNDFRKRATIDGRGNVTRYDYDAFGRLHQIVHIVDGPVGAPDLRPIRNRQGHTRIFSYDKLDNVLLERFFEWSAADTYSLLRRVSNEYDERGRKIREIHDLFGNPVNAGNAELAAFEAAPPLGSSQIETWFFPDGNGCIIERREGVVQAGPQANHGSSVIANYDHAGRVTSSAARLLDRNGLEITRTETTYDLNGNAVRVDRFDFEYDGNDVLIATEVISRATEFDAFNRRVAETDGLGNTTRFRYDSRDLLLAQQDPTGNVVKFDYDVYGRKLRSTETVSNLHEVITTYSYDADGQVTEIRRGDSTTPLIVKSRYEYNAIHNQTARILAADTAVEKRLTSHYDVGGNLALNAHPNGLQEMLTYDRLNRLERVEFKLAAVIPPNPPVLGASVETFVFDGLGRLVRAETDLGLTAVETLYDSMGRPRQETQMIAGMPPLVIQRSFDALGNREEFRYPSGRVLKFDFDLASRLLSVQDTQRGNPNVGLPGAGARVVMNRRYIGWRSREETYANGTSRTDHYDGAGRRISVNHADAAGSFLELIQLYDSAGDLRNDWQDGNQAIAPARGYAYDGMHRLTMVGGAAAAPPKVLGLSPPAAAAHVLAGQAAIDALIIPPGPPEANYVYDAGCNRVAETVSASATPVDILDQEIARTYDDNGNTIAVGGATLRYDARNRLVEVAGGALPVSMVYDALGRRVTLNEGLTATRFVFDGASETAELRNGALDVEYVVATPPDGRVQLTADQESFTIHGDLVGSTRVVTNSRGDVIGRWEFDPYGTALPVGIDFARCRHRFMGRQWDVAVALYHFRARHYDPSVASFLQRDPLLPPPGRSEYYAFRSNPLIYVDPTGTRESHAGEAMRPYPTIGPAVYQMDVPWDRLDQEQINRSNLFENLSGATMHRVSLQRAEREKRRARWAFGHDGDASGIWHTFKAAGWVLMSAVGPLNFLSLVGGAGSSMGRLGPNATGNAEATVSEPILRARDAAEPIARRLVDQELASGQVRPEFAKARFGTWLDAIAKAHVRESIAVGELPSSVVTSPTVAINEGFPRAAYGAPDVWNTATGEAWDFMAANTRAVLSHDKYLGRFALHYDNTLSTSTTIKSVNPVLHLGY